MSIQVECGRCGKESSAPDDWAGRWAKCPKCGAKVEIPTPLGEVEPVEPMADLLNEELGTGPAVADPMSDPFAAMSAPAASGDPFTRALPPKRSKTARRPSGGGGLKELVLSHKLITAVALMTGWILLNQLIALVRMGFWIGHLFGFGMVAVGVVIVLAGLRSQPVRRDRAADKRRAGQMAAWLSVGIVGIGTTFFGVMIGGSMGFAIPTLANFSGPFIAVFGIMGLISGIVLVYYVLVLLFPRLNVFLIGAWGFLGLTGLSVLVSTLALLSLPSSADLGEPGEPFATKSVPLPGVPERGTPRTLMPGVNLEDVFLTTSGSGPGHYNRLQIYTPPGTHGARSLPCVLIAPAGTNLISGSRLGDDADHPERVPYVLAGYAVVAFELDGEYPSEEPTDAQMRRAYREFAAAQAGLVNARNALEYVLAKMPEVDPARIYAVGHSSAATLALLFAEHEPRLRACVAFAPVIDVTAHFGAEAALLRMFLPGAGDFFVKSSPKTHAAHLECPLFLFHARDDSVVPVAESIAFAKTLEGLGKDVTLQTVSSGDHYDAMIEPGIPSAIEWLAGHGGPGFASPAQVAGTDVGAVRPVGPPSAEMPMPGLPFQTAGPPSVPAPVGPPGIRVSPRAPAVPGPPSVGPPGPAGRASSEAKLDRLIEELRSAGSSEGRLGLTLSRLAALAPIESRREDVAGLLDPFLTSSNAFVQTSALRAVAAWGTARNVPALLGLLDDPSPATKLPLIGALKSIPDPRATEALVRLVTDSAFGTTAAHALEKMGPAAEEAVITLLEHEDHQVRYRACNVLQKIGGEKSIAALQELLQRDTHVWSRAAAEIALRKLSGG